MTPDHPTHARPDGDESAQNASAAGAFREEAVWEQLRTVRDPEIPVNIVELGLIYSVQSAPGEGGGRVEVRMSLTAPGCGMSDVIKAEVERKIAALPGVSQVHVEVVFDPPWNPGMMSEGAKLALGFDAGFGVPAPGVSDFRILR
jgi:metal-sulfur cluster biosynthetic enzyme